jgi:hypothetical protein
MSIGFTPSQLHIIQLAMTEAEFIDGQEYTSQARKELDGMFRIGFVPAPYPSSMDIQWTDEALNVEKRRWLEDERCIERELEAAIILIRRAYTRFRKEFEYYTVKRCKLSVVREYHSLLIDTLAPFHEVVEGF